MPTRPTAVSTQREPELVGRTVVVIGGSAGIGCRPRLCWNLRDAISSEGDVI